MKSIQEPSSNLQFPFVSLGFRPFFFVAGLAGFLLMLIWLVIYQTEGFTFTAYSKQMWHAHEMVFAYSTAVIVGFLLTAVTNWTNRPTITGLPLMLLTLLWLSARITPFIAGISLSLQAILDTSFLVIASYFICKPIIQAKAWAQMGIASKVLIMAMLHILFYAGALGYVENGMHWGLYGTFYMIVSLIFVMARRVIPFFIEKGTQTSIPIKNYRLVDRLSLLLFLLYALMDVFWSSSYIYLVAILLFLLHSFRLIFWHRSEIWNKPLLWSLFIGYLFLTLAFGLKALSAWMPLSPFIILHSFALGIGMITVSMMSRVSLGHSGRNVMQPPASIQWIFIVTVMAYLFRVIVLITETEHYLFWITCAQIAWCIAFLLFLKQFTVIFFRASK